MAFFLSPIDQKVPLGETEWTGGWCCPTTSQCQDNVGVSPLHNAHLNIDRLPEDFCDRIISITVVGHVGLITWGTPPGFNQNQVWNALGRQDKALPSAQPLVTHWPLASLSSTLRGPGAATGGGGGTELTSTTRASTEVPENLHWKRSLYNRWWACSIYQSLTFTPSHRSLTQNDCPLWWNQTVRSLLHRRKSFCSHTQHILCPPVNRNTAYDRLDANKAE